MAVQLPTFEDLLKKTATSFEHIYKRKPDIAACAPGRVNLIGEHIDYCDGFVLPMALPMVTIIVGRKNDTKSDCNITTMCAEADQPKQVQFQIENLCSGTPKWANYVKGVISHYGFSVPGFDAVINTNVPIGGGLSSSAALEVATLKFIEIIADEKYAKEKDKALICQKAEHTFANMPCGIMDQFISVMGKEKHALLIDCQSLNVNHIPFDAEDLLVLICNSNVKHELSSSEYPTRRKQCSEALKLMGLESYREANLSHLKALEGSAENVLIKRARHVIGEIERTLKASEALKSCDFITVGRLMLESHKSLSSDFEVSCHELDKLVDLAMQCNGVLGSRMTGGGFGGCTVSLVLSKEIDNVIKQIDSEYSGATFYVCKPADGARAIDLGNLN
ncbi:CLUMA_CG010996, isoform A [Clunio marinus]|uniref:CLUMA_CG010996, isoform A n=1 Tax=Clunio marinus TaxID=568069 RepID=A0A1J1ICY3_9DIPT|nr:CLUMA_CG010996, isoform A [Clunio marinus]